MKKYYLIYQINSVLLTGVGHLEYETKEQLEKDLNDNKPKILKIIYGEELELSIKDNE